VATNSAVTAQATPDKTVAVAAGTAYTNNAANTVAAGNLTIADAHPTLDRLDAIVYDATTGVKSVIQGTPMDSLNLQPPDTTGYTVLAYVQVYSRANPSFTGTITPDVIRDQRDDVLLSAQANTLAYTYSTSTAAADPGSGKLAFDSATLTAITKARLNYDVPGSQPWLRQQTNMLTNMNTYFLRIWSLQDPGVFVLLLCNTKTHNTTYIELGCKVVQASGSITTLAFTTDPGDTIVEYVGPVGVPEQGTSALGADVTMTNANQFYDGPNTGSIGGAGQQLLLTAYATVVGGGAGTLSMRITDGTTVFAETGAAGFTTGGAGLALTTIVSPSAAATYKITCASTQAGGAIKADPTANSSGAHVATRISWVRLA